MRIIIARHGETTDNIEGRISGQSDCPLTETGQRQAQALAERLATEELEAVYTSPLRRASDTAAIVAAPHKLPVAVEPDLCEIGMGGWEGRLLSDIEQEDPQLVARWRQRPSANLPPDGEPLEQLADRVERTMRKHAGWHNGTIVWCAHGALTGVFLCRLLGVELDRRRQVHTDNASVTELDVLDDVVVLRSLNDRHHTADLLGDGLSSMYVAGRA
jgi:broad specificity phosphatase PhoE